MRRLVICFPLLLIVVGTAWAQSTTQPTTQAIEMTGSSDPGSLVRADLRIERAVVQSGQPVWAELSLTNLTSDPLTLQVPDVPVDPNAPEQMGLPVSHVFSGTGFSAVSITDSRGDSLDTQVALRPRGALPALHLAPYGQIGVRVDLTRYYESLLRRPGKYTLIWRPYGGTVQSAPTGITLLAEQQAVMLTDQGKITMRFYYDEAPSHVQNFVELIQQRFYDNLTFHRIVPGALIQGGDPRGNGLGIRPDGKRLAAEFSKIPFEAGTVGMAHSPKDQDSASCQFFICLNRQAYFDGKQTAFGYLVGQESFDTLRKIAAMPIDSRDRPKQPVYIRAISLENVPARDRELANMAPAAAPPPGSPAAVAPTRAAAPTSRAASWQDSRMFNLSRRTAVKGVMVYNPLATRPSTAAKAVPTTRPSGASRALVATRPAGK